MKIRNDFVTNSSSTNFAIYNKSDVDKTLVDFIREVPIVIRWWNAYIEEEDFSDSELDRTENDLLREKKIWKLRDFELVNDLKMIIPSHRIFMTEVDSNDYSDTILDHFLLVIGYLHTMCGESESFAYNQQDYYKGVNK